MHPVEILETIASNNETQMWILKQWATLDTQLQSQIWATTAYDIQLAYATAAWCFTGLILCHGSLVFHWSISVTKLKFAEILKIIEDSFAAQKSDTRKISIVYHLYNASGGSRIFKRARLIEPRGTNSRIATTAHGHRACWWLPSLFRKGRLPPLP